MFHKVVGRGSSSIGFLFALTLGTFVTLGFANVAQYLAAENALEQSTRATLRCLTPTDPQCLTFASLNDSKAAWNYFIQESGKQTEFYAKEFDYSAAAYRTVYGFTARYLRIPQRSTSTLEVESALLPLARWQNVERQKSVAVRYGFEADEPWTKARPKTPHFPTVYLEIERVHENLPFASFQSEAQLTERERMLRASFTRIFSRTFRISASGSTQTAHFTSPTSIPLSLLTRGEQPVSGCVDGQICSAAGEAGMTAHSEPDDFKQRRFLALYLQIRLANAKGTPKVSVQGEKGEDGFILKISDGRTIFLGGRGSEPVGPEERYFNLWLRGPRGARGSSDASAPEHSGIFVPIGGSFVPQINLTVAGDSGDSVEGEITLFGFADTYATEPGVEHVSGLCPEIEVERGAALSSTTPSAEYCGLTPHAQNVQIRRISVDERALGCVPAQSTLWPESAVVPETGIAELSPPAERLALLCNQSLPDVPADSCGWRIIGFEPVPVEIPSLEAGQCAFTLTRRTKSLPCTEEEHAEAACDGDGGACPLWATIQNKTQNDLTQLRTAGVELPVELSNPTLNAKIRSGRRLPDRLSCLEPTNQSPILCGSVEEVEIESSPTWLFSKRPHSLNDYLIPAELSELTECLSKAASDAEAVAEAQTVQISGFPFDGSSELELNGLPPKVTGVSPTCDPADAKLPIELLLRHYAEANGFQGATDPGVRFDSEARDLQRTRSLFRSRECVPGSTRSTPSCSAVRAHALEPELCSRMRDLGSFPENSPPAICSLPGMLCTKAKAPKMEPHEDALASIGTARAIELGLEVLNRFLPELRKDCPKSDGSAANCGTIEATVMGSTAEVTGRFELPVFWPLSTLIGRSTITLTTSKSERLEGV